ncbi:MAG: TIGR04282 family arsenosugar biosynthesis glycosyltransferase [Trichlorobacter sp.]|uniref:TIGR04282 family arsenosugar biosynthesis glycosyltransferase n=1 Tax=Trichlorobacter sp. TaxID=2911007 RepID=UPI0025679DEB|nr:TIGR04282 family arsenosugar biosynthesis glycosyltransferase [Trichlorobacter sp.]MDK9718113.1 TIGR04282 family arsenosugar biosynthesis glycosyltransferase [Trichlorobacter sp.]
MSNHRIVALFVKPPIPGRVKTRLARDIGDQAACDLYRRLADHTIQQIQASSIPLALFFDGSDPATLPPAWLQASQVCLPQQGNDLGDRMAAAFRHLFAEHVKQAVLIGSDIPGIDAAYLQQAFYLLNDHAMVLGPALDGGYCLIGFNQNHFAESIFQNIPWSTEHVLNLTLNAAAQAGLTVGLLPTLRDIDTVEDLQYLNPAKLQID